MGRGERDRSVLRSSAYRAQGNPVMITWRPVIKQKSRGEIRTARARRRERLDTHLRVASARQAARRLQL
jgi:hypothetical protein